MRGIILLSIFVSFMGCKSEVKNQQLIKDKLVYDTKKEIVSEKSVIKKDSLAVEVYDFEGFQKFLNDKNGKTYVINFWATWCAPCVKELPYFEKLQKKYSDKNVQVILVSLDMPKMYETHLIPFIKKRKLESKIIALDDPNQNEWIPKVDRSWSGAIPATYIYKENNSRFIESSLDFEELEEITLTIKNSK